MARWLPAVVSVAARHGDADLYNQFLAQMQKPSSPEQFYMFARALGQFPEPELIQQHAECDAHRQGARTGLVHAVADDGQSHQPAGNVGLHARATSSQLQAKAGGGLGSAGLFLYGTEAFCSNEKAEEVKQFFQQHPFPGTERNQKEALESISSCVDLRTSSRATCRPG